MLRRALGVGPSMVAAVTPSAPSTRSHGALRAGPAGRGTHGPLLCSMINRLSEKLMRKDWAYRLLIKLQHQSSFHNFPSRLFDFRYKGTLASILSKVDMDWLWDFSGRKPFWIGGYPGVVLLIDSKQDHSHVILTH